MNDLQGKHGNKTHAERRERERVTIYLLVRETKKEKKIKKMSDRMKKSISEWHAVFFPLPSSHRGFFFSIKAVISSTASPHTKTPHGTVPLSSTSQSYTVLLLSASSSFVPLCFPSVLPVLWIPPSIYRSFFIISPFILCVWSPWGSVATAGKQAFLVNFCLQCEQRSTRIQAANTGQQPATAWRCNTFSLARGQYCSDGSSCRAVKLVNKNIKCWCLIV